MEINKPQLLLVKNGEKFELMSITFCSSFNVEPDDNTIMTPANSENIVNITLKAIVDQTASLEVKNLNCLNPIVHRVDLGTLVQENLESEDPEIQEEIEVSFVFIDSNTGIERSGGNSKIKTVAAGGHLLPTNP